ncbi:hypothetical protein TOK_3599 [Pseudonocardia sp. N23]|nr:hypothetical protein TOK_3599 [Pseudonocardia sp. N23]
MRGAHDDDVGAARALDAGIGPTYFDLVLEVFTGHTSSVALDLR